MRKLVSIIFVVVMFLVTASSQANGKLQLHFIDVGQGDAAVLISPLGEIVMFDDGVAKYCDLPITYLDQLGIRQIDYHITSHYHDDHIGCASEVFTKFPIKKTVYDRGYSNPSTVFSKYEKASGTQRKTATAGEKLILDGKSKNPVIIVFVAENGAGVSTTNENDLSLVSVIHFGKLDIEMGGDLSGFDADSYKDIESLVADKVGKVEVYKVHHHGSRYSSNDKWLSVLKPKVGIISASETNGRNHNHPTEECLERLHKAGVKTYWTEKGGGADPDPAFDIVGGNIVIEAEPNSDKFTVKYNWSIVDTFKDWETSSTATVIENSTTVNTSSPEIQFAWSKNSSVYHYSDCKYVSKINPENLVKGNTQPEGKTLHEGCPK